MGSSKLGWLEINSTLHLLVGADDVNILGGSLHTVQEEINSRLKSGNACYHSVQNLLSSSLLSKNLKIKVYRTIILPVVLYGCETWSLTLREEHRLRVFENRGLRRILGPQRDEKTGSGENYIMRSLTIRLLMSYIYGAPILDVSRSHTTTQHSR